MYSILLVDDEPLALRGNRIIIERSGLEVTGLYEAVDGQEAWGFLQDHEVDLVITDIKMPRMDGVSLCRELFLSGREVKTVIVSGYADFQYAREALRYGVKDYILKPVQREELIQSISSVLYQADAGRKDDFAYIPHGELDNILTILQQGLWMGDEGDVEQGLSMYRDAMGQVREDYCLKASGDFCRLLSEKLSLKTGHTLTLQPQFTPGCKKEQVMMITADFVAVLKKELKSRRETDYTDVLLDMANKYLEENYAQDISLADLAAKTGFSTNYFSSIFKEKIGKSFVQCRTEYRVEKAKQLLCWSAKSITEIAAEVGYNDFTYFNRVFKELTGQTPGGYKKSNAGEKAGRKERV